MRVTELGAVAVKPLRTAGGFFAFSLDTLITMVKPPFAWREFLEQTVFLARVALLPALMLSIPYVVLTVFTFNVLLVEFGCQSKGFVRVLLAAHGLVESSQALVHPAVTRGQLRRFL